MADEVYTFRSALHGFHRGDVISYLGSLASAHANEVAALEERLHCLEEENAALRQNNTAKKPAQPAQAQSNLAAQELEAYRRAERYERESRERAAQLYAQACTAVENTRAKLSAQQLQLGEVNATLSDDIAALQTMLEQIRCRLSETQFQMEKMEHSLTLPEPDPT